MCDCDEKVELGASYSPWKCVTYKLLLSDGRRGPEKYHAIKLILLSCTICFGTRISFTDFYRRSSSKLVPYSLDCGQCSRTPRYFPRMIYHPFPLHGRHFKSNDFQRQWQWKWAIPEWRLSVQVHHWRGCCGYSRSDLETLARTITLAVVITSYARCAYSRWIFSS